MKIIEDINNFTKQKSYRIIIKQDEGIEAIEIAECFKRQYPRKIALISFAKVLEMELGMIFVGINFGGQKAKNEK